MDLTMTTPRVRMVAQPTLLPMCPPPSNDSIENTPLDEGMGVGTQTDHPEGPGAPPDTARNVTCLDIGKIFSLFGNGACAATFWGPKKSFEGDDDLQQGLLCPAGGSSA